VSFEGLPSRADRGTGSGPAGGVGVDGVEQRQGSFGALHIDGSKSGDSEQKIVTQVVIGLVAIFPKILKDSTDVPEVALGGEKEAKANLGVNLEASERRKSPAVHGFPTLQQESVVGVNYRPRWCRS
jgi:hypothetical protein